MKKDKLLLLVSVASVCAVAGTVVYATSGLNNSAVFAAVPGPSGEELVLNIDTFERSTTMSYAFVATTAYGNKINISWYTNGGTGDIIESEHELLLHYNDHFNNYMLDYPDNAITGITSIAVIFNGALSLSLDKWKDNVESNRQRYDFGGGNYLYNLASGVAYDVTNNLPSWLPNSFTIYANDTTSVTSIRITYYCQ